MIESEKNVSISQYTQYKIGGIAREAYFPKDSGELIELLDRLKSSGTAYYILGGGSNVLVGDGFFDGAAILMIRMNDYKPLADRIECGAGIKSSDVAEIALDHSKSGLEFLYLLPGTVGGALAGNARYDNVNISEILIELTAVHPEEGLRIFSVSNIAFDYKFNSLSSDGWLFCEAALEWKDGNRNAIRQRMNEIEANRSESKHFELPSCGCIFKNDYKRNIQAGKLIDSLGLKGMTVGGAQVAPFHANFIVNTGNATAKDVMELIEKLEKTIIEKTGITLEREVRILGTF